MPKSTMTTDPIADLLTRIRNAVLVNHDSLLVPHSKMKMHLLKILKEQGYVADFKVSKEPAGINVELTDATKMITMIRRLSKPGRRLYAKASDIPVSRGGQGLVIISTSQGLMSAGEARKRRLGGELICEVW